MTQAPFYVDSSSYPEDNEYDVLDLYQEEEEFEYPEYDDVPAAF